LGLWTVDEDAIGYVRHHKLIKAGGQRSALVKDICRAIIEEGKPGQNRAALEKRVREGTLIKLYSLFLLAEPTSRRKPGGWRKDLLDAMARIEKRGGIIKDVSMQATTSNPEQRYGMVAVALEKLSKNGRSTPLHPRKRGRIAQSFTADDMAKAKAVWESRKYKTWEQARAALPKGFTPERAYRLWGKRS